jgi:hypothetical protein
MAAGTVFIGRETELGRLDAALDRAGQEAELATWLGDLDRSRSAVRRGLAAADGIEAFDQGLLTVLLGLGYAVVVLGLGRLLPEGSSLVVAAATLAAAAAFQPLRRRVQGLVDRRFNRRRYDASRTLDTFSARLRDQLDLDALHGELLAVVDQTMQPTRASLWLRR